MRLRFGYAFFEPAWRARETRVPRTHRDVARDLRPARRNSGRRQELVIEVEQLFIPDQRLL
eukprot:7367812-Heterocapsa_arctica.AAC.1